MSSTDRTRSIPRSIGAVVTGFATIGALSLGSAVLLQRAVPGAFAAGTGRVDDPRILLFMMAYVGAYAVLGCWLCARLAPRRPMRHALVLGALGFALNVGSAIQLWDATPAWYSIVSLLLTMPYAWAGGRIREWQLAHGDHAIPATGAIA